MSTNLEVVKQFCRYYENGEKESYLKLCDDNIVWESTRADGGACRSKREIFDEYLPRWYSQFKEFSSVHEEFLDSGENVVALGRYKITSKSGEKFESPFAQVYTVRDGKIVRFRQYADSLSIQQARAPTLIQSTIIRDQQFAKISPNLIHCVCGHKYTIEDLKEDETREVECPNCKKKTRVAKLKMGRIQPDDEKR